MVDMRDRIVGHYKIQHKIGSGNFASVYKATHQQTQSTVAIKIINQELLNSVSKKEHFFNEVEIFKSLHHPFIAELFNMFEIEN
jgi:serine/threonine-protein kinase ULK/ATG1